MCPTPTLYGSRQSRETAHAARFRPLLGGTACLDFVNTVTRHDDPSASDDFGSGYVQFLGWCSHASLVDEATARRLAIVAGKEPREAASVRRRALSLRSSLQHVLQAIVTGDDPEDGDLAVLNEEVARARAVEVLVPKEPGLSWQVPAPPSLESPLLAIARDTAEVLASDRAGRIRQCAGPECERYFLDTSRNGSRRFCSPTGCGSQERVRRFRERQKQLA
jgi:predicted RNA-binding Zn ribbon-like protein